ncbi:uncharacterized protein LOC113352472 [Papaver somniferum]|uniref:uncharacterized protein LOC113352472 n=1 Tax=Papaver somniferum TaxID=3469 RepID=UPI000E6FDEFD|nr:uncharacterized protein LOC113352472 [Papaver somniferum]
MSFAHPSSTSIATTHSTATAAPFSDPSLYKSVVGVLQYATITRQDIAFAVNKSFQFMQSPTEVHWTAVELILRYLQGTLGYGLQFKQPSSLQLQVFSNADWDGDITDRRSTSGMAIFMGPNIISWCSRKQKQFPNQSLRLSITLWLMLL